MRTTRHRTEKKYQYHCFYLHDFSMVDFLPCGHSTLVFAFEKYAKRKKGAVASIESYKYLTYSLSRHYHLWICVLCIRPTTTFYHFHLNAKSLHWFELNLHRILLWWKSFLNSTKRVCWWEKEEIISINYFLLCGVKLKSIAIKKEVAFIFLSSLCKKREKFRHLLCYHRHSEQYIHDTLI